MGDSGAGGGDPKEGFAADVAEVEGADAEAGGLEVALPQGVQEQLEEPPRGRLALAAASLVLVLLVLALNLLARTFTRKPGQGR